MSESILKLIFNKFRSDLPPFISDAAIFRVIQSCGEYNEFHKEDISKILDEKFVVNYGGIENHGLVINLFEQDTYYPISLAFDAISGKLIST